MEIKRFHPVIEGHEPLQDKGGILTGSDQKLAEDEPPVIGQCCRGCLNAYYGFNLNRGDCKYEVMENGHRATGRCNSCRMVRPIVQGFTMIGRLKTKGKI